jgi:cellulase
MLAATFVAAAALASPALAHGGVLSYSWGGQWYKGFTPYNSAAGQVCVLRRSPSPVCTR